MNIYDIAKLANVSISTVSRVINNPEVVKPETRAHVLKIMSKHSYIPNAMARGLVYKSMKIIGLMMNDLMHQHFQIIAAELEKMFFGWNYTTLVSNIGDDDTEKFEKYLRTFAGQKVDGLVVIGSFLNDTEVENLLKIYMPTTPVIVSSYSNIKLPSVCSVQVDHYFGMQLCIRYLISKGHKDIGFVYCRDSNNTKRKIEAFLRVLRENKLKINREQNTIITTSGSQGGFELAEKYRSEKPPYSVFVCTDDAIAVGALNGFKSQGLSVPNDIAIVGYDNTELALCSDPSLTTIDPKAENQAIVMANTMHDLLDNKTVGNSISIRPEFVIREST